MAQDPWFVGQVAVEAILDLRWEVLRPGRPRATAIFPGDAQERTRHYAVLRDGRALACLSVMHAPFPVAWHPGGDGSTAASHPLAPTAPPTWQLRGMATAPSVRGRGYGARLLRCAELDLGEPMWCNARVEAADFYARHGWRVCSEPFHIDGVGPHLRMCGGVRVIGRGRFLTLCTQGRWEQARRTTGGAVGIIAVDGEHLLLVEQHRPAVNTTVIEIPAGLIGDEGDPAASPQQTAARELAEETGYTAGDWQLVADGPPSAGLADERVWIYLARRLRRVGPGGGVGGEDITVHRVALAELQPFLRRARQRGALIDPKVLTAMFVLGVSWDGAGFAAGDPRGDKA